MGYWTTFDVEMEFIPRNKEVVDFALKYFQSQLSMEGAYKVNGENYTLMFNDQWKNRNAFLEDIFLTIEKYSTVLECNIYESGEEPTDQHEWKIVDGIIQKHYAIRDCPSVTSKEDLVCLFEEINVTYFSVRDFTTLADTELETDEIEDIIDNTYSGTEESFDAFLVFMEEETKGDYNLIIDKTDESYQITCKEGKLEFYELKSTSTPDKIMSLEKVIKQQKMINNQLYGFSNLSNFSVSFISDIDFENTMIEFEDNDGIARPFHAFFLDEFFDNKSRGEKHHTLNGEELSLCGMCVNKMRQVVGDCYNCSGAKIMIEPKEKLLLKIKN